MNEALLERIRVSNKSDLADRLLARISGYGPSAVAFSAGVDSTVVAKAAQLALGEQAIAVTAVSPSLAAGELEQAVALAAEIGIRHRVIRSQEIDDPRYVENDSNRCYFCKTELYSRLHEWLEEWGVGTVLNGVNQDDLSDHRPGLQAAEEHQVRSPLAECGFTKQDVRQLAAEWKLPVYDKPAMPCLASRIAYGEQVTAERMRMVDAAEQFLKSQGYGEVRVRYHRDALARVEVPADRLAELLQEPLRNAMHTHFEQLGFRFVTVDVAGFRSGSLNSVIPLSEIRQSVPSPRPVDSATDGTGGRLT